MSSIKVLVDAQEVLAELDRLAAGPDPRKFESIMTSTYMAVDAQVHVLTGKLKGSGHMESTWSGDTWEGTIGFLRYPGIFELARGNQPTLNHPEGGHHFYEPAYDTPKLYEAAITDWLADSGGA